MRLPGPLLVPLGFAALVCLTQLTTWKGATAGLTVPAVVVVALAGFALSRARLRELRPARPVVAVGLGTFLLYAGAALLTGHRTFLGYPTLGDAAIHFELVDR